MEPQCSPARSSRPPPDGSRGTSPGALSRLASSDVGLQDTMEGPTAPAPGPTATQPHARGGGSQLGPAVAGSQSPGRGSQRGHPAPGNRRRHLGTATPSCLQGSWHPVGGAREAVQPPQHPGSPPGSASTPVSAAPEGGRGDGTCPQHRFPTGPSVRPKQREGSPEQGPAVSGRAVSSRQPPRGHQSREAGGRALPGQGGALRAPGPTAQADQPSWPHWHAELLGGWTGDDSWDTEPPAPCGKGAVKTAPELHPRRF